MGTQALHVGDQVIGRVVAGLAAGSAAAAAALVEQHGTVAPRIEEAALARAAAAARTAMQIHRRQARPAADLFEIEAMTVADIQPARVEGLDFGIEVQQPVP